MAWSYDYGASSSTSLQGFESCLDSKIITVKTGVENRPSDIV
jgi:hypothetical protein